MINKLNYYPKKFYALKSDINCYASKSYSKQELKSEFDIQTTLNEYSLEISLFKKNSKKDHGYIYANFAPKIQFKGKLMEFDFMDLTDNESTVILSGNLKIMGIIKQKSFIGSIKTIDGIIYLNSNFILNIEEYNFDKVFKCPEITNAKSVKIELTLQLK